MLNRPNNISTPIPKIHLNPKSRLETSLPLRTVKRGNAVIPKVIKSYNQNKWIKTNINKHKETKSSYENSSRHHNKTGPTHKNNNQQSKTDQMSKSVYLQ